MNLSETAFVAKRWNKDSETDDNRFTLRWFTPSQEVELCGHATLATAHAIFNSIASSSSPEPKLIRFDTKFKGIITARSEDNRLIIDFPLNDSQPLDRTHDWINSILRLTLGSHISEEAVKEIEYSETTKKLLVRLNDVSNPERLIREVSPDFEHLMAVETNNMIRGIIVTVKGEEFHFLSRYFAPWNGINEDPVTGAAHTVLAPFWKRQYQAMGITIEELVGHQCSQRGGVVDCRIDGDRVHLSGTARIFLSGTIDI